MIKPEKWCSPHTRVSKPRGSPASKYSIMFACRSACVVRTPVVGSDLWSPNVQSPISMTVSHLAICIIRYLLAICIINVKKIRGERLPSLSNRAMSQALRSVAIAAPPRYVGLIRLPLPTRRPFAAEALILVAALIGELRHGFEGFVDRTVALVVEELFQPFFVRIFHVEAGVVIADRHVLFAQII